MKFYSVKSDGILMPLPFINNLTSSNINIIRLLLLEIFILIIPFSILFTLTNISMKFNNEIMTFIVLSWFFLLTIISSHYSSVIIMIINDYKKTHYYRNNFIVRFISIICIFVFFIYVKDDFNKIFIINQNLSQESNNIIVSKNAKASELKVLNAVGENLNDRSFKNLEFYGTSLINYKFRNVEIEKSVFKNVDFTNSKFNHIIFFNSTFDNSSFKGTKFTQDIIERSSEYNNKGIWNKFSSPQEIFDLKFKQVKFNNNSILDGAFFNHIEIEDRVIFDDSSLKAVHFHPYFYLNEKGEKAKVYFDNSDIRGANFFISKDNLSNLNFNNSRLNGSFFNYITRDIFLKKNLEVKNIRGILFRNELEDKVKVDSFIKERKKIICENYFIYRSLINFNINEAEVFNSNYKTSIMKKVLDTCPRFLYY
ncbi:pentapeptide repeat-containing protein [Arcobacter sp. CECT 8983]|uniref:pentapeptide repeat-containing protein n=1 Tax=Arcobacter sp. CECT 8983 TaxID=2044508 RepID=UPI0013E92B49|nr:pentapeptide repeat-containing protein [Arcobacter sp. CECT 8983]